MNRLGSNDRNWGPFTLARWNHSISAEISGGDDEDPENYAMITAFGWALRARLPKLIKPAGKYGECERIYGFSLSASGDNKSKDFLNIHYGPQTGDSSTEKRWGYFLPWLQSRHVRHSLYNPDGSHFADWPKTRNWRAGFDLKEKCPKVHFEFMDFDGERIIATCTIEEREWHRGEGWFKWLKYFYPPFIRRVLDLNFSAETGKKKGSWKGGTTGTSIDMLPGELPESAFRRYCEKSHKTKDGDYSLTFIGPCGPPLPKPTVQPIAQSNNDTDSRK